MSYLGRRPRRTGFAIALACATALMLAAASGASAATFMVTSQNDANDGLCNATHCSLREAILTANATNGADEIIFNDDEAITPRTPLPPITETTHIVARGNGSCRGDSAPLVLEGDSADFPGLVFAPGADGSHLCLVHVSGFVNGIELRSDRNAIRFSTIGTSPDGNSARPNSDTGIVVTGDNNLIGSDNVISGNTRNGIFVAEGAGTRIEDNFIGLDADGIAAVPNGTGVLVAETASDTTVGGTEADTRNVISGNGLHGVASGDGRVVGNLIGLDADGTAAVPNESSGVTALAAIQIGGRTQAERNVISAAGLADVVLQAPATVEGNWIGLAADGTELTNDSALGQLNGILLFSGADGAIIGGTDSGAGNVIAGHAGASVVSTDAAGGFSLQGNLIGLAADGTTRVPTRVGVRIGPGTSDAQVGGVEDGAGNTVVAENETGIAVAGDRTRIEGNAIGLDTTDDSGKFVVQEIGISVEGSAEDTTIGGDSPGAGNTISANAFGIELKEGSTGTAVEGNFIGTDRDGMEARGNEIGVSIGDEELGGARVEARIGGVRPAQRNVISGNQDIGVSARCVKADVAIEGNYIGVGADGSTALGNLIGLILGCDTFVSPAPAPDDGFVVGGTASGAGNRIAHNNSDGFDFGDGVEVGHTSGGVMILGNEIFDNDRSVPNAPGIDLMEEGVSANGSHDADVLPPFPVLTNVDAVAAGTLVQGTIDYPAGRNVRLEFFSNPSCDISGHGEGQTPLGALTLIGSGVPAAFSARVDAAPVGHAITATATDLDLHRTSEFSRCASTTAGPPPPPPDDPKPGPDSGDPPAPQPVDDGSVPPLGIDVIDVPPRLRCKVPSVVGLTLAKARQRLALAGCGVGKVTRPKRRPGKGFRLVVKRTSLRQGATRPQGAAIGLTLEWKRRR